MDARVSTEVLGNGLLGYVLYLDSRLSELLRIWLKGLEVAGKHANAVLG